MSLAGSHRSRAMAGPTPEGNLPMNEDAWENPPVQPPANPSNPLSHISGVVAQVAPPATGVSAPSAPSVVVAHAPAAADATSMAQAVLDPTGAAQWVRALADPATRAAMARLLNQAGAGAGASAAPPPYRGAHAVRSDVHHVTHVPIAHDIAARQVGPHESGVGGTRAPPPDGALNAGAPIASPAAGGQHPLITVQEFLRQRPDFLADAAVSGDVPSRNADPKIVLPPLPVWDGTKATYRPDMLIQLVESRARYLNATQQAMIQLLTCAVSSS
jgi:hypothetical protein